MLLDLFLILQFIVKISSIKVIGHDTSVKIGESGTFFSQLTDTKDSLTRIIWRKRTREDSIEKPFFVILPDGKTENINGLMDRIKFVGSFTEKIGSVELLGMRLLDEGIYTCIFNLFPSGPFETNINVTVLVPPKVIIKGATPIVSNDTNVTLASCVAANARPAAEVLWTLGPLESLHIETNRTMHPNGTFTVVSNLVGSAFKDLNQKNVQCVVKHEALDKELVLDYSLDIHYPPESVMIIPDSTAVSKEFHCVVDSNPRPTNYTWSRVNNTTPKNEGKKLLFTNLSPDLNGLYICNASNEYGSSLGSLYVYVHTESSSVCWVLLIFIICPAVCSMVYFAYKWWRRKQNSQSEPQDTAQEREPEEDLMLHSATDTAQEREPEEEPEEDLMLHSATDTAREREPEEDLMLHSATVCED